MATSIYAINTAPPAIEAKVVVVGAMGAGKTSLVERYIHPHAALSSQPSTVGASFVTHRVLDSDSGSLVRLQIWDTAGQERFRSLSRLYYRGANAILLCYDITNEDSFEQMKGWLREIREHCDDDRIIHVVGTKADVVTEDPSKRAVSFERTITYIAENIAGVPLSASPPNGSINSPDSKRNSGYWNQDLGWDMLHEVSSATGEGIEEVFRVIASKLVTQRYQREVQLIAATPAGRSDITNDYFSSSHGQTGSFRVGADRKSWLGLPSVGLGVDALMTPKITTNTDEARARGRCC